MEGSDWRPAFRADQAWRELGSRMPVTVDYRPGADGRDALTVTMTVGARVGHPTTLTLGVNAEHGVFADPVTIEALGGRSASAAPGDDTLDPRTDVPRNVSNMASTGIEDDEIDRAWEALNEIARSHPAAVLWHEEMGGSRDLPRHAEPDRRVAARPRGDIATPAQSPVAAAGAAARAAARRPTTNTPAASRPAAGPGRGESRPRRPLRPGAQTRSRPTVRPTTHDTRPPSPATGRQ